MDETVRCPGCQASLALPPVPAGQTVQCPRCQRVFEPFAPRGDAGITVAAPPATEVLHVHQGTDEDDFTLPARPRTPVAPLSGPWLGYVTMLVLSA